MAGLVLVDFLGPFSYNIFIVNAQQGVERGRDQELPGQP